MRALIGYTGFVGSNLRREGQYDMFFNSKNSDEMRNQSFCEVVCAGVRAVKWIANNDPIDDKAKIKSLVNNLQQINTKLFILVSTVDVYHPAINVYEDSPVSLSCDSYGQNRAELESFVSSYFKKYLIIRLPALFGPGLKKNALFDLMNDNMIDKINPDCCYQWYDVQRLERDIRKMVEADLQICNIAAEPIAMSVIAEKFFPGKHLKQDPDREPIKYDMRTKHAEALGGRGDYHLERQEILELISNYLRQGK